MLNIFLSKDVYYGLYFTTLIFYIGYYCPEASIDPYSFECGNASVYCPRGSALPTVAHSGFYTIYTGDAAASDQFWQNSNHNRVQL